MQMDDRGPASAASIEDLAISSGVIGQVFRLLGVDRTGDGAADDDLGHGDSSSNSMRRTVPQPAPKDQRRRRTIAPSGMVAARRSAIKR